MKKHTRSIKPAQATELKVFCAPDPELDWTPPKDKVRPRVVSALGGGILVEVQEARMGSDASSKLILCVAAWLCGNSKRASAKDQNFWLELQPAQLDTLIRLLTEASSAAKSLGIPSHKGSQGGMTLPA